MNCTSCRRRNPPGLSYCDHCGSILPETGSPEAGVPADGVSGTFDADDIMGKIRLDTALLWSGVVFIGLFVLPWGWGVNRTAWSWDVLRRASKLATPVYYLLFAGVGLIALRSVPGMSARTKSIVAGVVALIALFLILNLSASSFGLRGMPRGLGGRSSAAPHKLMWFGILMLAIGCARVAQSNRSLAGRIVLGVGAGIVLLLFLVPPSWMGSAGWVPAGSRSQPMAAALVAAASKVSAKTGAVGIFMMVFVALYLGVALAAALALRGLRPPSVDNLEFSSHASLLLGVRTYLASFIVLLFAMVFAMIVIASSMKLFLFFLLYWGGAAAACFILTTGGAAATIGLVEDKLMPGPAS